MPQVWTSGYRGSAMGEGVLTSGFTRTESGLACEGVPLERIAREVGTPAYVYSAAMVRDRFVRLDEALAARAAPDSLHAEGELERRPAPAAAGARRRRRRRVRRRAVPRAARSASRGDDIVFGGVGKTDRELREALQAGVKLVNAESRGRGPRAGPDRRRARERRRASDCASIPKSRSTARTATSRRASAGPSSASRSTRCSRSRASPRRCRTSRCTASTCTSGRSSSASTRTSMAWSG